MATKINVRSPFYIKVTGANTTLTLDLKIWTGSVASVPASPTYSLSKASTFVSAGSYYATFEISELIRDYVETTFDGSYASSAVYVTDGTTTYIAVDGYGYFEEGVNPQLSRTKLISNNVIWRPSNENIRIPVYGEEQLDVVFAYKGNAVNSYTYSFSTTTSLLIKYPDALGTSTVDNYRQRVLDDSGTYEYNILLRQFESQADVNAIDEIHIYKYTGGVIVSNDIIKVRTMECNRYPDRKVTFVNKFGALQDVYFFAKEVEGITTTSETFKRNSFNDNALTYSGHQYQSYNTQGKERITLSTGFVSEDYNEVLKQMMISEQVWLTKTTDEESNVFPVNPVTNSLSYQTSLNDKLVSYTIEFEYAFDKIQNIR